MVKIVAITGGEAVDGGDGGPPAWGCSGGWTLRGDVLKSMVMSDDLLVLPENSACDSFHCSPNPEAKMTVSTAKIPDHVDRLAQKIQGEKRQSPNEPGHL